MGDTRVIRVDVRIISSSNQNLAEKISNNEFREDFYYRLNVVSIELPALRDRPEDIPLIANHLLEKHCAKLNKPLKRLSPELMNLFLKRTWVGNVREMENIILQGILFSTTDEIRPRDINFNEILPDDSRMENSFQRLPYKEAKEQTLQHFNAGYIGNLLAANNGNVTQAARSCGLERQALQQIMRRYKVKANAFRKK
ncbi:MAG: hypothetical protein SRB2_04796 [Desulfobacteraceae bacterium Eth-SRB2]|nr:MAG: hypothetical protein SRB2_04796 [Desulfobacteraceae bacterium Eth-SRB2]